MAQSVLTNTKQIHFSKGNVSGWDFCDADWAWSPRYLPNHNLWYIVSGQGTMQRDGQAFSLKPGFLHLMRPGERLEATQDPFNRLSVIYIHFQLKSDAEHRIPSFGLAQNSIERILRQMLVMNRIGEANENEFDRLMKKVLFLTDSAAAHSNKTLHKGYANDASNDGDEQKRWVHDILELFQHNPLAAHSKLTQALPHYSPRHLQRIFKQYTGRSMREYIHMVKMNKALRLLRREETNITEVAHHLGYSDPYAFSNGFKKYFGIAPSTYRSFSTPHR